MPTASTLRSVLFASRLVLHCGVLLLLTATSWADETSAPAFDPDAWMVQPAAALAMREKLTLDYPDAFASVTDNPALPRVLLIGDSISIGYTPAVRQSLAAIANVHRIPDNGGATTLALAMLDEWLGDGHWDVIHFNFGLHDVARVRDSEVRTPPETYAINLRRIVARLQATGAKLIFATTTPVPGQTRNPSRDNQDVLAINAAATAIMHDARLPIDDLYATVGDRLTELQIDHNVHFRPPGYEVLGTAVADAIKQIL